MLTTTETVSEVWEPTEDFNLGRLLPQDIPLHILEHKFKKGALLTPVHFERTLLGYMKTLFVRHKA